MFKYHGCGSTDAREELDTRRETLLCIARITWKKMVG